MKAKEAWARGGGGGGRGDRPVKLKGTHSQSK